MKKPRQFPPLPKMVDGPVGPFRVVLGTIDNERSDEENFGVWSELHREMRINKDHPRWQQWVSYFHEHTHVALSDSGVDEMLSKKQMEAVCDAVATARFRERFG